MKEAIEGCKMSFYWQQAVPQDSGQPAGGSYAQTSSTWDNINLGGGTPQPSQQTYGYGTQQNGYASGGGYETYVNPYSAVNQSFDSTQHQPHTTQQHVQQNHYIQQQQHYIPQQHANAEQLQQHQNPLYQHVSPQQQQQQAQNMQHYYEQQAAYEKAAQLQQVFAEQAVKPPTENGQPLWGPSDVSNKIEHQPIIPPVEEAPSSLVQFAPPPIEQYQQPVHDGWGIDGWSSHEPSVEPASLVENTTSGHESSTEPFHAVNNANMPLVPESAQHHRTSTMSSHESTPQEHLRQDFYQHEIPHEKMPRSRTQSAQSNHSHYSNQSKRGSQGGVPDLTHQYYQPSNNHGLAISMGAFEENPVKKEVKEEIVEAKKCEEVAMNNQPVEQPTRQLNGGESAWGVWDDEGETGNEPRTSTPADRLGVLPTVMEDASAIASPISAEIAQETARPASPKPLSNIFPPPPPIVLAQAEIAEQHAAKESPSAEKISPSVSTGPQPSPQASVANTDGTQKTPTPPASMDSWVEVSSSGSDPHHPPVPAQPSLLGEDPPIASSSPLRLNNPLLANEKVEHGAKESVQQAHEQANQQKGPPNADSDSTNGSSSHGKSGMNVRDRYNNIRQQYPALLNRISQYRHSGRESNKTPTRVTNPLLEAGKPGLRSSSVVAAKSSTPKELLGGQEQSLFKPDLSAIEGKMYMDHSMDASAESARGYGEDIVDAQRRDRHRANRSRPGSRAKSEMGDDPRVVRDPRLRAPQSHHGGSHHQYGRASAYDQSMMMHPQYGYYPSGRYSLGRHSSLGMAYGANPAAYYQGYPYDRRPNSTYDAASYRRMERSGRSAAEYDAFEYPSSDDSDEEEEEGPPRNESEDELRRISHSASAAAAARSRAVHSAVSAPLAPPLYRGGGVPYPNDVAPFERKLGMMETHYFGFVKMEIGVVHELLRTIPPPAEFWTTLDPLERVGYVYYTYLHRKNFANVHAFQLRFKREFYKYQCENYSEGDSLVKICSSIQDHFKQNRLAQSQRAYEASQRQLFSDDRETPDSRDKEEGGEFDLEFDASFDAALVDGIRPILRSRSAPRFPFTNGCEMVESESDSLQPAIPSILRKIKNKLRRLSDRGSVYDQRHASDADDASIDNRPREPLMFRCPHAFVTFGPGGRIVQVNPERAVGSIFMTDVHCVVKARETERNVSLATHFRGPLLPDQTPPHIVRAYIQRQMDRIRRSDLAQNEPRNDDVVDCLLVWQLLEMVVQQHGKVIGPDIARLLMSAGPANKRDKPSLLMSSLGSPLEMTIAVPSPDSKSYERFTMYLLEGLVDEAIDYAMAEGLFMDAVTLARRLAPHRVEQIEARHLATRPQSHPVLTLLAVANGQAAPCLTNISNDERGSWRWHAALLFANLAQSPIAMDNIRSLGEVLARRDYNSAADFCFLSVALLSGADLFTPPPIEALAPGMPPATRRHIELIHASIPDDIAESTLCEYGFSLTDLHATEIFDYGSRLSGGATALPVSVAYQKKRMQYAKLLANWGGFSLDAFRYCTEVARTMWCNLYVFTAEELTELAELADRLQKVSSADEAMTMWIASLRATIPTLQHQAPPVAEQQQNQLTQQYNDNQSAYGGMSETTVTQQPVQHQQKQQQQPYYAPQAQVEDAARESRSRSQSISSEAAAWHQRHQDPLEMRGATVPQIHENTAEAHHSRRNSYQTVPPSPPHSNNSQYHTPPSPGYPQNTERSSYEDYSTTVSGAGTTSEESTPRRAPQGREIDLMDDDFSIGVQKQQQTPAMNPLAPSPAPPPPSNTSAGPPSMPMMHSMPSMPSAPLQQQTAPRPSIPPKPSRQELQQRSTPSPQPPNAKGKQQQGSGGGLLPGWLKDKLIKVTSTNEMKLPDDKKKTIYYDEKLGKYVGEGVEEEQAAAPPPVMGGPSSLGPPAPGAGGGGLRSARISGGSRYFNPLNDTTGGPHAAVPAPSMMPPTGPSFSFIPSMPDDAVSDSPFSISSSPPEGTEPHSTAQQ